MAETMNKVLFLQQVWCFMLPGVGKPRVPVFEDNEGAVKLAQISVTNSKSKHIDVRHHFQRESCRSCEGNYLHNACAVGMTTY